MNEFHSIPTSISHKQLSKILKDLAKLNNKNNNISDDIEVRAINDQLNEWNILTKKILLDLAKKKDYLIKDKGPNALMALGAYEVHLSMALQALKASEKND
tara:strand:+ start:16 stop:318 length:303 start_codon:yes stop_codon:yes gene_type:complete